MRRTTSSSARATRSTSCFVQGFLQKLYDNGHVYQDVYAGLYCVGCEAFKTEADLVDGKCPEHNTVPEWIEERNWFFRLSSFQAAAARALRARRLRPARVPGERGAQLHRGRPPGLLDQPRGADLGHPDPVGSGFDRLRLGGRPRQLPERAHLRASRARIWSRRSGRRSGTCSPRTSCASTASTGPRCCSPPGYEPPQQLFVHGYLLLDDRKISKSLGNVVDPLDLLDVYGTDPVRFWCARAVSFGQDGAASIAGHPRALRARARQRSRQPALADDGDGRALPQRHAARPADAGRRRRGRARAARRRRRGAARRVRRHGRARAHLGRRPHAQPRGRDDRAVAAGEGRGARRRSRPGALRPRRRPAGGRRRAVRLHPGHGGGDPRGAAAARTTLDWSLVAYGLTAETHGIEAAPPLFPRLELPAA